MPVPELVPAIRDGNQYFVHPTAQISPDATIGEGVQIHAGARIGDFTHIGEGTVVGRGVIIAGSVSVAAGVQFRDTTDDNLRSWEPSTIEVGFGAIIKNNARVESNTHTRITRVGAFATVIASTTARGILRPFGLYDGSDQAGWVDPFGKIVSRRTEVVPEWVTLNDELAATLSRNSDMAPGRQAEFVREVEAAYEQLRQ